MAARKEIEKVVKYKEFQRSVEKLLTPEDEDYLFYALKEYNTYKSVGKLMLALNSCLDSPEKLDLLPYIRDLIPKHDKKRFDRLAPYDRMAHPLQIEPPTGIRTVGGASGDSSTASSQNRIVNLQRNKDLALGFSIRGGQEHDLGIYVSHVESLSQAEKAGLQVGDQIMRVNGIDFERVSHGSAVLVLTSHDNLKIEVKNTGNVPGQILNKHTSFVWVDAYGNPVEEPDEDKHSKRHSIVRDERSPDRLLSSVDKRKIVLHSSKKRSLGFSIRGGSEYGLGVYISVVDPGSPSEEAGLKVGDQILDINGHSFLSILHYEAVHILKSYATLILTIKSLGRIPTLQVNEQNEAEPMEQSPIVRRRSNEMFTGSSVQVKRSKRPTSATIVEEEEPEETDHAHSPTQSSQPRPRSSSLRHFESDRSSNLKRSDSQRSSQSVSNPRNYEVESADSSKKSRSFSFGGAGIPNFSQRPSIMKKTVAVSPLATHEARASTTSSPSPVSSPSPDAQTRARPKFFERGLGTQVMLANVSSQAKQLLFDKARRELSEEDAEILKEDLIQYDDTGNIEQFVHCLISIFNTPEKMELMRDIRSVVKPTDIVRFDEMISPHELKTLRERISESDSDQDEWDDLNMDALEGSKEDGIVLTGVQHTNGHHEQDVFGSRQRLASLSNGRNNGSYLLSNSAPELHEIRSKETSFSQSKLEDSISLTARRSNGSHFQQRNSPQLSAKPFLPHAIPQLETKPQGNPVIIDIDKEAPYIGLAIRTTHDNCVLVKDVRPGGAIDRDGFIQPGFEIVQVDNIRIRGKSYHDAAREIADAFKSKGPTVQFIVIPDYA